MRSLLTLPGSFGNSGLPQTVEGVTDALSSPKLVQKSGHFCFCHQRATGVSCGRGYILAEQRPGVRETPAALHWPGSVVSAFFCAQLPKQCRCHMLRFFLSSRFLRFRYRLQFLAERSASVLALAAVFFMAFVGVTA